MATPNYNPFTGLTVRTNVNLTKKEIRTVKRTWKQRLFTRPWRPWVATRTEAYDAPSDECFVFHNSLVCHPEFAKRLRTVIEAQPVKGDTVKW